MSSVGSKLSGWVTNFWNTASADAMRAPKIKTRGTAITSPRATGAHFFRSVRCPKSFHWTSSIRKRKSPKVPRKTAVRRILTAVACRSGMLSVTDSDVETCPGQGTARRYAHRLCPVRLWRPAESKAFGRSLHAARAELADDVGG